MTDTAESILNEESDWTLLEQANIVLTAYLKWDGILSTSNCIMAARVCRDYIRIMNELKLRKENAEILLEDE